MSTSCLELLIVVELLVRVYDYSSVRICPPQIRCDKEGLFQEPARDRSSLYAQLDSIRVEHYKRESVRWRGGGLYNM